MRLLVCALAIGCGGLEIHELAPAAPHVPDDPADEPIPWKGGDDEPDLLPGADGRADGPVHLLRLSEAISDVVPEVEELLAGGNDVVFRVDLLDSPAIEGRLAAVSPSGEQDYCVPTLDVVGAYDERDFRIVAQASSFEATALAWRGIALEGTVEGDLLVDLVLSAEIPREGVASTDLCETVDCRPCSLLPGVAQQICAIVPLQLEAEPLEAFEIEPLTVGDAAAACP